jgi:hypothetical protein
MMWATEDWPPPKWKENVKITTLGKEETAVHQ